MRASLGVFGVIELEKPPVTGIKDRFLPVSGALANSGRKSGDPRKGHYLTEEIVASRSGFWVAEYPSTPSASIPEYPRTHKFRCSTLPAANQHLKPYHQS
ncbi:hypothetical protein V499_01342 [Pseudogymnoascus sp. VKM F-103]|nr:hypothetical protein V499_01342 [Pseudogymnoascus sp. VKM F-103]